METQRSHSFFPKPYPLTKVSGALGLSPGCVPSADVWLPWEEPGSQIMGVMPRISLLQDASVTSVLSKPAFKQFGDTVLKMVNAVTAVPVPAKPSRASFKCASACLCEHCQELYRQFHLCFWRLDLVIFNY